MTINSNITYPKASDIPDRANDLIAAIAKAMLDEGESCVARSRHASRYHHHHLRILPLGLPRQDARCGVIALVWAAIAVTLVACIGARVPKLTA